MARQTLRTALLVLTCVLAGRLATVEAGPPQRTAEKTTQVVYPVADLVVPLEVGTEGLARVLVPAHRGHPILAQCHDEAFDGATRIEGRRWTLIDDAVEQRAAVRVQMGNARTH